MTFIFKHSAVRRLSTAYPLSRIFMAKPNKLCSKVSTFVTNTINGAKIIEKEYSDYYDPNDFKGHALEVLIEFWIRNSPFDNRLGIMDYTPVVGSEEDWGVDGFGKSLIDSCAATLQSKFRSNSEKFLTANSDHISNFVAHSYAKYFDSDTQISMAMKEKEGLCVDNMLIITTARDLHPKMTEEMYNKKVRVINYENMKSMLDDCKAFWYSLYEALVENEKV